MSGNVRIGTKKGVWVFVIVVSILASSYLLIDLERPTTGLVAGAAEPHQQTLRHLTSRAYTDDLHLEVSESSVYQWTVGQGCAGEGCRLASVKISGSLHARQSGQAGISLEHDGNRYLLLNKTVELNTTSPARNVTGEENVSLTNETAGEIVTEDIAIEENTPVTNETTNDTSGLIRENATPPITGEENIPFPNNTTNETAMEIVTMAQEVNLIVEQPEIVYFTDSCLDTCDIAEPLAAGSYTIRFDVSPGMTLTIDTISYRWQEPAELTVYDFAGGQVMELEEPYVYPHTGSFSAEAWITISTPKDAAVISSGECCEIEAYWAMGLSWSVDAALQDIAFLFVRLNDGAGEISGVGTINIADGRWHHLAFVRDAGQKKVKGYVDGVPEIAFDDTTQDIADANTRLLIGNGNIYQNEWFIGRVAQVRTTNSAWGEETIRQAYAAGVDTFSQVNE